MKDNERKRRRAKKNLLLFLNCTVTFLPEISMFLYNSFLTISTKTAESVFAIKMKMKILPT
jgi:hypothetical protein